MREGNHSILANPGLSVSADGARMTLGENHDIDGDVQVLLLDRARGSRSPIAATISSGFGLRISPDGSRFFYRGRFRGIGGRLVFGLSWADLSSDVQQIVAENAEEFYYSVNLSGRRVAYQKIISGATDPREPRVLRYFFKDLESGEERQLTDAPDAVAPRNHDRCPRESGGRPMIDDEGRRIVILTASTLGIVPENPNSGCYAFTYDVDRGTWELAATLPPETSLDSPEMDGDGRLVSFSTHRRVESGSLQAFPALLNLESGELTDPLGGVDQFGAFDSVITRNGRYVVISSRMDLDPRVGNADNNMELFLYNLESGEFDQIAETTGGIGLNTAGCPGIDPKVSGDAEVVAFNFFILSVETCQLEQPQRNEVDGFELRDVRAVRIRPGNRGPVWSAATHARALAGETLEIDFEATDPDDDPLTYFAQERGGRDVPIGSEMRDHHDGTATFRWPTRPEHAGTHMVRVAVFDEGGGEELVDIEIAVCARVIEDGDAAGVIEGLFNDAPPVPPACRAADANGDGRITAADLLPIEAAA